MISIKQAVFCDEVTLGDYNKINIIGYIPSDKLAINSLPYRFQSNFLVEANIKKENKAEKLLIEYTLKDKNNENKFILGDYSLTEIAINNNDDSLLLVYPVDLSIVDYNTFFKVSCFVNNSLTYENDFTFVEGHAPNINVNKPIPSSALLGINTSEFTLKDLISRANKELIIIDQYIEVGFLINEIIPFINRGTKIKILASPKLKSDYKRKIHEINIDFCTPEVRFIKTFHDRFIVINESEYYHFGHSLKDTSRNRISKYSKIIAHDELNKFRNQFTIEWQNADTL